MLKFQNINLNILNKTQNYFIMDKETNVRKEKKVFAGNIGNLSSMFHMKKLKF